METLRVECLGCGQARTCLADARGHHLDPGECPRCGYLGWAPSVALTEPARRRLRERPLDRRAAAFAA
jgi:hypothetical protein